jgi:low affinity Fe/Cu permease
MMSEWQWVVNGGIAAAVLILVVKWLGKTADKLIDRAIPLGERYVASTEKLHDKLDERMNGQQTLCEQHGEAIVTHDKQMRAAARQACQLCREVARSELPRAAAVIDRHCTEIERIIGEA